MLILDRYLGQKIVVNDNIFITLINVRSNTVKLGFEAPQDVKIYRDEIYQRMLRQGEIFHVEQEIEFK
jgi:carbon storage regulator